MFAQTTTDAGSSAAAAGGLGIFFLLYLVLIVLYLVGMWKLFTKMGQPGWVGIIPILNVYGIYKLAGREWWWVILLFVPCIQIIAVFFLASDTAKLFAKELGWTLALFFFWPIASMILAFGSSEYVGPREQIV